MIVIVLRFLDKKKHRSLSMNNNLCKKNSLNDTSPNGTLVKRHMTKVSSNGETQLRHMGIPSLKNKVRHFIRQFLVSHWHS